MKFLKWVKLFFKGAFKDTLFEPLEKDLREREETLLLLLFLHFSGMENPFGFFSLELLPYFEIKPGFLKRFVEKEELLSKLFARFDAWA